MKYYLISINIVFLFVRPAMIFNFINLNTSPLKLISMGVVLFVLLSGCKQQKDENDDKTVKTVVKDEFTLLNDEIQANPGKPELYYKRAGIFLQKNNTRQAYEDISKAVAIDSTKAEYYLLMADICFKGLLIEKSADAFLKAIMLNPSNTEARLKLAELFLYIKSYPKCIEMVNDALKINKNLAKGYFIKGFAYKETGDTSKAISSFQTCVEVNPEYYDAYIQLGNIHAARKNTLALQYYNNALRLQPSSTEAYYNRGLLFQNMGELEKAANDYKTILKIDRNYAGAFFNLGYIDLAYKKDYNSAINNFTDAIRVNTQYVEAFYNRGVAYELSGNIQAALRDYKEAVNIVPTYKLALDKLKSLDGKSNNRKPS